MKKLFYTAVLALGSFTAANAQSTIYGEVLPGSSNHQGNNQYGMVWLIEKCTSSAGTTLTAIDSNVLDSIGAFQFAHTTPPSGCHYLLKAAYNSTSSNYATYLPSYYAGYNAGNISWSGAADADTPGYYVLGMVQGTNPGGPGFIGGNVAQGANKTTAVGDPLNMRTILVTDANDVPVTWAMSDATGAFSISNLAYGTYKVFGDAWGLQNPVLYVTLDATTPSYSNILFEENDSKFQGRFIWATNVATTSSVLSNVSVYPNPANDVINVSGLDKVEGAKQVTVATVTGAVVYSNTFSADDKVVIPASQLANGVYMLHVHTEAGNIDFKVVK